MYRFYLNGIQLPIPPEKMTMNMNGQNQTYELIQGGEINVLKLAKLTEVDFEILLPNQQYSFADYGDANFHPADYYLERLESLKQSCKPFLLQIAREFPKKVTANIYDGKGKKSGTYRLHDTELKVSLEEYTVTESAELGFDFQVAIKLKQYREYKTTVSKLTKDGKVDDENQRNDSSNAPNQKLPKTALIKRGDTLWGLAKKYYGDGSKYQKIATHNHIANPNRIQVGQKITIPSLDRR